MIGRHLGSKVSEVVDDHLVGAERRRALEHLASCEACREAVAQERRARRAASSLRDVGLPEGLSERIVALSTCRPEAGDGPVERAPWAPISAAGSRRPAARAVLVGAAAAGVAGLAAVSGLYALGASQWRSPETLTQMGAVTPTTFVAQAEDDAADGPSSVHLSATGWPSGYVAPASLPGATTVSDARAIEPGVVVVELQIDGATVTVVEAHGRLDLPVESDRTRELGGQTVHEIDGWWVAQVGTDVVAVRGDADAAELVLDSFQTRGDGWTAWSSRVEAGWRVVTGG